MDVGGIKKVLNGKTALIIGCGGLGCYVVELLARLDFGSLIICDNDKFEESNMNRQLYCAYSTIGRYKAKVAEERVKDISKITKAEGVVIRIDENNINDLIKKADIVFDCADNVDTRLLISKKCTEHDMKLIHGAISDTGGQIVFAVPPLNLIEDIYRYKDYQKIPTLSYTPPFASVLMVNEAVKYFAGLGETLDNRIFLFDLFTNNYDIL